MCKLCGRNQQPCVSQGSRMFKIQKIITEYSGENGCRAMLNHWHQTKEDIDVFIVKLLTRRVQKKFGAEWSALLRMTNRKENIGEIKRRQREYNLANRDKISAKIKEYRVANKEKIALQVKEYSKKNKDKIRKRVSSMSRK